MSDPEEFPRGPRFGARHVQLFLLVSLCALEANVRITLPNTITAMTRPNISSNPDIQPYDWNNTEIIKSSFDWGYIVMPMIGGKLATTFGTKWIMTLAVLLNSAAFVLIPCSAEHLGATAVIIFRVFQGLCAGLYSTLCYHILAQWTPVKEMSKTVATLNSGYSIGYMATVAPLGYICDSWIGWPAAYYLFGCLGVLWTIPWIIFASDTPSEHKTITTQEKLYIQASLASREENKIIPWRAIITSLPMSAIIISVAAKGCLDSLVLNEIHSHMTSIMEFSVIKSGRLFFVSYLLRTLMIILGGFISDWLVNKHYLSRTITRKIFNTIGTIVPAIALPFLGYCGLNKSDDQTVKYISNLLIVTAASAATYDGCMVNIMDISPTFCATLRGITSFFYTSFVLLLPLATGYIIKNDENDKLEVEWIMLFIEVSCINIFGGLFYIFFASGKTQRWIPVSKIRLYGSIRRADEKVAIDSSL